MVLKCSGRVGRFACAANLEELMASGVLKMLKNKLKPDGEWVVWRD